MTHREDDLLAGRLAALEDPRDDSDWEDVFRRALEQPSTSGRRFRGRRALLIAAVVAVLVLALGVALATTLGGFSGWLSGKPGSPASPTEQQAFQQANARSWAAFPSGTKLRRLIVTRSGGSTYRLFGFRSGDEICLRLTVDGVDRGALMSCIPRLELVKAKAPGAVALVDAPAGKVRSVLTGRRIGVSRQRVRALSSLVSFGITADGVSSVELQVGRRSKSALVANNAFLFIRRNLPYSGVAVSRITAINSSNRRADIPFTRSDVRSVSHLSMTVPFGPSHVDLRPPRRSIEWILRREPRGVSIRQAGIPLRLISGHYYGIHFARVLQPNPRDHMRIVVSVVGTHNGICMTTIASTRGGGGGGCVNFKYGSPINSGFSVDRAGEQSAVVSGLASDAVSSIDLFLSDGERWPVPLKDNAFVIAVPRIHLPAKLVAYDEQNRVIGIDVYPSF